MTPPHATAAQAPVQARKGDATTLDLLRVPVLVTDAKASILRCNRAAGELLDRGLVLRARSNRLSAVAPRDTAQLQALITRVTARGAGRRDEPAVCTVGSADGGRRVLMGFPDEALPQEGAAGPNAVIVVVDVKARGGLQRCGMLRELFGLTEAEDRIARHVAAGLTPGAITTATGLSMATVRTHLSRIYQKTETATHANLVRLLVTLAQFC